MSLATAPRYYAEQQHLTALAIRQVRTAASLPEALKLLAVYQSTAALLALENGTSALREQDTSDAGAAVVPEAFTVVPDAPSVLDDIVPGPRFDRIVGTLVGDAGRSAMGAFVASRQETIGHVRQLTPPSCSRCAILAGRWYRWSDGFQRHPRCDCIMVPGSRDLAVYDPHAAYERGEISDLTAAQRQAIADGADINQVVNSRRGMQKVSFAGRRVAVTTEGTTARGLAFHPLSNRGTTTSRFDAGARPVTRTVARAPRLSPEAIYEISPDDREQAIRLLRANGYIL